MVLVKLPTLHMRIPAGIGVRTSIATLRCNRRFTKINCKSLSGQRVIVWYGSQGHCKFRHIFVVATTEVPDQLVEAS